jgi:O-acetyl-ADP-ribose deacetylase
MLLSYSASCVGASMNQRSLPKTFLSGRVRVLVYDAIVNAANTTLLGGGGVDGAIHRRGGPRILEECRKLRASRFPQGLLTGEAVLTSAGALPARLVIHTVGPIVRGGREPDSALLAACYRNSLALAAEGQLRSIAFPAISTGAYGYPRGEAAPVVSSTIESFLREPTSITEVRFYDASDARVFLEHQIFTSE